MNNMHLALTQASCRMQGLKSSPQYCGANLMKILQAYGCGLIMITRLHTSGTTIHLVNAGRLSGKLTEECHGILWRLLDHAMANIEYVFVWPCLLETPGDLSSDDILCSRQALC